MVESPFTFISNAVFYGNHASMGFTSSTSAYACGDGHGGAVCLIGAPGSNVSIHNALFISNTASFGGGISLHADSSCTLQQLVNGCFSANIDDSCMFSNNTAVDGAGGALFWTHPKNLNITCSSWQIPSSFMVSDSSEPANLLSAAPCSDWLGNQVTGAGYGPIIASTSMRLTPMTHEVPYYTSNQLLPLSVFTQVIRCLCR